MKRTNPFLMGYISNREIMKLWLLEILACPLDKAYPLELTILRWQNETETQEKLTHLLNGFQNRQVLFEEMETPIKLNLETSDGITKINDDLIIKPTPFSEYLSQIIAKIAELNVVHDVSTPQGREILNLIQTSVKPHLENALEETKNNTAESILPTIQSELELLNLFKYHLEIEDAVIKCPQCGRWYPVFDAIPQLLPDGVRNSEEDHSFAEKWKNSFKFSPLPES